MIAANRAPHLEKKVVSTQSMSRPRILYVCSCWPHDRAFGGQLRALHVGRALQQFGRPTLVVVGAHDVDAEARARTAAEFDLGREIQVVNTPARGIIKRSTSMLNRRFTTIHGVVAKAADEAWLIDAQRQFDLIWFFKLRTANYFRTAHWTRSVVDVDDVPSTMEKSRLQTDADFRTRAKAWLRMIELRRHEKRLSRRFDIVAVCSEADRSILANRRLTPHIIPNGFARPAAEPAWNPVDPPRIGFMGLYSYLPNLDGIRWFMDHCWQRIREQIPGVTLRLIGQDSDGPLKPQDPSVTGLGWVENPAAEVATWSLMIVPIRIGAGTRVKIPDAFSRKCPLVSTRFGALGYDVRHNRELLLADDPREFANACLSLIRDRQQAAALARRAYEAFLEKWTWDAIAPRVWSAASDCLRRNFGR